MLHNLNKKHANKYIVALPLMALFIFNINTQIIAQTTTTTPQPEDVKIGQNVLKYVITKDTKDIQLESIKEKMAEKDVIIVYKDVGRNDKKEITGIRIEYESKKGSGQFFVNSDEPIKDIAITLNINENRLSVGQAMKNLSQSFEIITEDGDKKIKTSGSGDNVFVFSTNDEDDNETVTVVGKDGDKHEVKKEKNVYVIKSNSVKNSTDADDAIFVKKNKKDTVWIKQDVKNIAWLNDDGEEVEIIAVEKSNKNIRLFSSAKDQPLILLDGKEIQSSEMSNIKTGNILTVDVLKGDTAIQKYGDRGKHGVIYIKMKDDASLNGANHTIAVGGGTIGTKKDASSEAKPNPWAIKTEIKMDDDEKAINNSQSNSTTTNQNYAVGYDYNAINEVNISYSISKSSTDLLMETFKAALKNVEVDVEFSKIKRTKNGDITSIKISLEDSEGQKTSQTWKSNDKTIPNIAFGKKGDKLFIRSIKK